jgi:hypothetical protein
VARQRSQRCHRDKNRCHDGGDHARRHRNLYDRLTLIVFCRDPSNVALVDHFLDGGGHASPRTLMLSLESCWIPPLMLMFLSLVGATVVRKSPTSLAHTLKAQRGGGRADPDCGLSMTSTRS